MRRELFWQTARALGTGALPGYRRFVLPTIVPRIGALAGAELRRALVLAASLGFMGLDNGRADGGVMIHEYRMFGVNPSGWTTEP